MSDFANDSNEFCPCSITFDRFRAGFIIFEDSSKSSFIALFACAVCRSHQPFSLEPIRAVSCQVWMDSLGRLTVQILESLGLRRFWVYTPGPKVLVKSGLRFLSLHARFACRSLYANILWLFACKMLSDLGFDFVEFRVVFPKRSNVGSLESRKFGPQTPSSKVLCQRATIQVGTIQLSSYEVPLLRVFWVYRSFQCLCHLGCRDRCALYSRQMVYARFLSDKRNLFVAVGSISEAYLHF